MMPKGEKRKGGAPSKKTPATLEAALSAAREGLPLRFCAGLAGITYQSLNEYRKADPDFAQRLETAMSEGVRGKWLKILAAGNRETPNSWQPLAWILERSYPSEFGRPEVQLGVQVNQTTNNTLVISVEQANELAARAKPVEAGVAKLVADHQSKRGQSGANGDQIREVEVELVQTGPITLPPANLRSSAWWKSLSSGDGARRITTEAARFVLQTLVVQVLGIVRASGVEIDLGDSDPTLGELWSAIDEAVGPAGRVLLAAKGEG